MQMQLKIVFSLLVLYSISCSAKTATNSMLETYLQLTNSKQEVLSENIANSSKPGYKTKDIKTPKNFRELSKISGNSVQVNMKTTNSKHLFGSKPRKKFRISLDRTATDLKPNGNNVSLTDEIKKASMNQISYDQALKAFQASNSIISSAIGGDR